MWLFLMILFVLVLVLFVKYSDLKKNLGFRIRELEIKIDQIKAGLDGAEPDDGAQAKPPPVEEALAGDDESGAKEPESGDEDIPESPEPVPMLRETVHEVSTPPPLPETQVVSDMVEEADREDGSGTMQSEGSFPGKEWKAYWEKTWKNMNWEQFTGVKLFSWLGGIALFVCAAFFVKWTIDRDLISPEMRLAIAAVLGMGLIVVSVIPDRVRYNILRQTLAAGGVGVLFTVLFAATLYYRFLPELVGFILLTVVSAAAFVLAIYHQGISVSVLGALGAYATPILVDPGQGNLVTLFLYLAIVNAGLFQVVKRLDSPALLLTAGAGTLISLSAGSFFGKDAIPDFTMAGVWIANLFLFTYFLDAMRISPERSRSVSWTGYLVFLWIMVPVLVLIQRQNEAGLLICTAGTMGAMILAFRNPGWHHRVIPYSVITFMAALYWVLASFDPRTVSWGFLVFMVYAVFAGFGPVLLIKKYGMNPSFLYWFQAYPIAIAALSLAAIVQEPRVSFWFWPLALGLQVLGLLISLLFRMFIQLGILVIIFVVSGLNWIFRVPLEWIGPGFYGFLLFSGVVLCVIMVFALRKLPAWTGFFNLGQDQGMPRKGPINLENWMTAAPAVGGFLLLAASFMVQKHLNPHPGMATMVCFLSLTLFLSKRLSFQHIGVTALVAAVFTEAVWMLGPVESRLHLSALQWSGGLFAVSLFMPFIYFKSYGTWNRIWMGWALFEVFQGLFIIWAADHIWPRQISGWLPMLLFAAKLPFVFVMLKQLAGKPERNAIIAFHGGVLLFYVSAIPVLLLDYGWIGLTLVYEAMALLWLNRRIEHPGLRWVAVFMAPMGLLLLLGHVPDMKGAGSLIILNSAVLSMAGAAVALFISVHLGHYPQRALKKMDLPNYFLWLALGAGFGLLNLVIADIFAEPGTGFRFFPGQDHGQSIWYGLVWAGFGGLVWKAGALTQRMRLVGLTILTLATAKLVLLPYIFPFAVPGMRPVFNLGLLAYAPLLALLIYLYLAEPAREGANGIRNLFLVLILVVSFVFIKVEKSTLFQTGEAFALFSSRTLSMAVASSAGWLAYGLGLLMWPRKLDRNFRMAGLGLVLFGLGKAGILPFRFRQEFGDMLPILNSPTLLYGVLLGVFSYLALKPKDPFWPLDKVNRRIFWGILLAGTTFYVLNIEIASAFGIKGRAFSLLTHGSLAHQLAYSLGWLLFASGLLMVGIRLGNARVRWSALILLVITTIKIFFMDLWKLELLYRVASFFGLAVILILVSSLYQRYLSQEEGHAENK